MIFTIMGTELDDKVKDGFYSFLEEQFGDEWWRNQGF